MQLSIVGHGPFSKELAAMVPEACYTGYLNGTELAKAYASSDVFVFPSTTDTFGNVIIEAQAAWLAVIVSDLVGPRELFTDGVYALISSAVSSKTNRYAKK